MVRDRSEARRAVFRVADVAGRWGARQTREELERLAITLGDPPSRKAERAAGVRLLLLLRAGSGQLSDLYVRGEEDGIDAAASERFARDLCWLWAYGRSLTRWWRWGYGDAGTRPT